MRWSNRTAWIGAVVVATLVGIGQAADASQRHKWWESGDIRNQLDITDDQADAIDEIYTEARPVLHSLMKALDREESQLSHLIADMDVADWELTLQIDKTEDARSALSKQRILMIYHMRQELTPDQRVGLRELQERQRSESRPAPARCF